MPSIKNSIQLLRNMGGRYVAFRLKHELKKKSGLFVKEFPQNPPFRSFISLAAWRMQSVRFFVDGPLRIQHEQPELEAIKRDFQYLKEGKISFFSSSVVDLGKDYDWVTNPDSGFRYNSKDHWSRINDFSKEAGDIKFVWEKSRFSFLYTIMRYDAGTGEDNAAWVWKEILSWIAANPINSGPNYKCSQEISLRVLNWTYALHFYKNSPSLTEEVFKEIIFSVYWQLQHVLRNINFSRIAVRNNHAITETLALYLGGLLYPFFPEADLWKTKGKKWFEEEIAYQIYEDGTFLQFSMNYHRVVVQLLSWGIRLADLNGERFKEVVYDRARKSLEFLTKCMEQESGWLPNYGANDGALFFRYSNNHYRDYRPQLEALARVLGMERSYGGYEDAIWYGLDKPDSKSSIFEAEEGSSAFKEGGYYLFRQEKSLSFIRCGTHRDRPSQADNLHLDVWYKGQNILHDAGSYKYNTHENDLKYFMGTCSHNTVMLDDADQMEKGARFIWYHWTRCEEATTTEDDDYYVFEGSIKAFQHISSDIRHHRKVIIHKKKPLWEVQDTIFNKPSEMVLKQLWHTRFPELLTFSAQLAGGENLEPLLQEGWYSDFYGKKESCSEIVFSTRENKVTTFISTEE